MLKLKFPIQDTKCHITFTTDDDELHEPPSLVDTTPDGENAMLTTIFGSLFCDSLESQELLVSYLQTVTNKLEDEVATTKFKRRVKKERLDFIVGPHENLED